jgi:hypothetical protein
MNTTAGAERVNPYLAFPLACLPSACVQWLDVVSRKIRQWPVGAYTQQDEWLQRSSLRVVIVWFRGEGGRQFMYTQSLSDASSYLLFGKQTQAST